MTASTTTRDAADGDSKVGSGGAAANYRDAASAGHAMRASGW